MIVLVTIALMGVAPVAVAAGLCAEKSCCQRDDQDGLAAPDCCGAVVCSNDPPDDLERSEHGNRVAPLAPVGHATTPAVRPATSPVLISTRVPAKSACERLSALSIFLI
ncbi:MAG TPA: hypothetical protein VMS98_10450 [Thermoanaerobaculia bacterium]|nr:hypothetical protein [Thermoanaerobaculia bacterium]